MQLVTIGSDQAIVEFGKERICLKEDGSAVIDVDFLIRNTGNTPIHRVRLILPYRLTATDSWRKIPLLGENLNKKAFLWWVRSKRGQDLQRIHLCSSSLVSRSGLWIYEKCMGVQVLKDDHEDHYLTLKRGKNSKVSGEIKLWRLQQPEDIGDMEWLLLSFNHLTVVDVVAVAEADAIHPPLPPQPGKRRPQQTKKSKGWFRVRIELPSATAKNEDVGDNLQPDTLVKRSSYQLILYSSRATQSAVENQLKGFDHEVAQFPMMSNEIKHAGGQLREKFLSSDWHNCEEIDWRIFAYPTPGSAWRWPEITHACCPPPLPDAPEDIALPAEAFPPGTRMGRWPCWVDRLFETKPKPVPYVAFWIGREHRPHDPGHSRREPEAHWRVQWWKTRRASPIWRSMRYLTILLLFLVAVFRFWGVIKTNLDLVARWLW